jgi:predicted DNA-binding transcriptional regulator YafY
MVSGLDEIVWWVLSLGPSCRVVAPDALAEKVQELAERTRDRYTDGKGKGGKSK